MLNKDEFLSNHPDIHTGMDAYSVDGAKLGEVERLDDDSITIEKGWFFPRDFTIRYDDVVDIREDHLVVRRSREDLEGWREEGYSGWAGYDRANREPMREAGRREETRTPLREEQFEAEEQVLPVSSSLLPAYCARKNNQDRPAAWNAGNAQCFALTDFDGGLFKIPGFAPPDRLVQLASMRDRWGKTLEGGSFG